MSNRRDTDFNGFPSALVDPGDYAVVRLYGSYEIGGHLTLKARVENLLDAGYEPVYGFPGLGRSIVLGAGIRF